VDVENASNGVKWLATEGFIDADKVLFEAAVPGGIPRWQLWRFKMFLKQVPATIDQ
jgi:hypothetical protein